MKHFASLKTKDILSLIGLVVIGFVWILIDQEFIKESGQRFPAFIGLMVILLQLQFRINKPQKIWPYANMIAVLLVAFVVLSSFVMHVFIFKDFPHNFGHSILIWIITGTMPYISGLIYVVLRKK